MNFADVSPIFGAKHAGTIETETLSVALIGPDKKRRSVMRKALADTRRANVREFDSYPPEVDYMKRLAASFDVIILDADSDPNVALGLMEKVNAGEMAKIMVYSEEADPKLAVRAMRAGAREYLQFPFEQGVVDEVLARIAAILQQRAVPPEKTLGKLLVFVGSKGGSGVTTVACNVAIALAQKSDQNILLIDLALPIGDAALCLGIAADYSTEDALRNIDRLDARFLQNLLVKHRSGVFVLAAPTKVPEVEVSKDAIDKLIAVARREFDHVIVDVGSRIDVAAKALFEDASTIYLVTQTGISELRNSNRLISQFFAEGSPNLEIVINRFESRFLETVNEDVIAKALGRPVRWKIPDDQDAARALQYGDTGPCRNAHFAHKPGDGQLDYRTAQFHRKRRGILSLRGLRKRCCADPVILAITRPTSIRIWLRPCAHPAITWPTPEPIAYGDKLTFAQLNATASVDGTFVYTPGPGYVLPVGTHTLWVTFTPADSGRYAPLQAAISIRCGQGNAGSPWPTPAEILYGTALDDAQLNASAPVPGRFEYSPAAGEVLPRDTHTLSVTFTPADSANYTTAQADRVAHRGQEQRLPSNGQRPIRSRTARSSARRNFVPRRRFREHSNTTLAWERCLRPGEHKLSVAFHARMISMGYSTSQASVSLTVAKATPAITWPTPDPIAQGAALSATQLNATATVPGSFAFTPAAGEILAPGVHELSVNLHSDRHFELHNGERSRVAHCRREVNRRSSPGRSRLPFPTAPH